jgi:hypothetical protein
MVMKIPKMKKKVMNHSHLITVEKQDFPIFWGKKILNSFIKVKKFKF